MAFLGDAAFDARSWWDPTATPLGWWWEELVASSGGAIALGTLDTSASGSDALSLSARRILTFAETGSGSDALTLTARRLLTLSDASAGSDAMTLSARRALVLATSGSGNDTLALAAKRALVGATAASGTDAVVLAARRALQLSDAGSGSDTAGPHALRPVTLADSASGSDTAGPHAARPIVASDAASGSDASTLSGASSPTPSLVLASSGSASDSMVLSAKRALVLSSAAAAYDDVELSGSSVVGRATHAGGGWSAQRKLDAVRRREQELQREQNAAREQNAEQRTETAALPLAPVPVVGAIDTARGTLADDTAAPSIGSAILPHTTEVPSADRRLDSEHPAAAPEAGHLDGPQAVVVPPNTPIVPAKLAIGARMEGEISEYAKLHNSDISRSMREQLPTSPALLPDLAAALASVAAKSPAVPIVVVSPEIAASLGLSDDELVAVLLAITTPAPSRRLTRAPAASGA